MGQVRSFKFWISTKLKIKALEETKEEEVYLGRTQFRLNQELSQSTSYPFRSAAETESDCLLLTLNDVPPCVSTPAAAEHQAVSSLDNVNASICLSTTPVCGSDIL